MIPAAPLNNSNLSVEEKRPTFLVFGYCKIISQNVEQYTPSAPRSFQVKCETSIFPDFLISVSLWPRPHVYGYS